MYVVVRLLQYNLAPKQQKLLSRRHRGTRVVVFVCFVCMVGAGFAYVRVCACVCVCVCKAVEFWRNKVV